MKSHFYRANFRFVATRFEEWQFGRCISKGNISTEILAEVYGDKIYFELNNIDNIRITKSFNFEILSESFCILPDRIQYSHNTSDYNPIVPIVCHIFYTGFNMECIRFAMTNPDRIIEFYGVMVEYGQLSKNINYKKKKNARTLAKDILDELRGYGMLNVAAIMERAVDLYNENAACANFVEAKLIVECLKLFIEAFNLAEMENNFVFKPKILLNIAWCNYKIDNKKRAYCIAQQALDAIDYAIEHSSFTGISRSVYGEDTIKELIRIIEAKHKDEFEKDDYNSIDPTCFDTLNFEKILSAKPSKSLIKSLIDFISKIQDHCTKSYCQEDYQMYYRMKLMFETFKIPLCFAWQGYEYGWQTDFSKEGDDFIPFMMFEANMTDKLNELIDLLREYSPFKNSSVTNALLSIYATFLTDLENNKFKYWK